MRKGNVSYRKDDGYSKRWNSEACATLCDLYSGSTIQWGGIPNFKHLRPSFTVLTWTLLIAPPCRARHLYRSGSLASVRLSMDSVMSKPLTRVSQTFAEKEA